MPHSERSMVRPARKRRVGVVLSVLAILVLFLLIAWLWALPAYIDQRLTAMLADRTGRQVSIDRVAVTPWRTQVTLEGLRIAGQADTPVFSSQRVVAILDWHSLFESGWRFERIDLKAPRLQLIWRSSGEWNLAKLFGGTGSGESTPLRIARLNVSDGRLDWINRLPDEPLTLSLQSLDLEARDYDNSDARPFTLEGRANWNGGTLKGNGEMGFAPWTVDIDLDADQVPLTTLSGYLAHVVRAEPAAGSLGAQIRLRAGRASDAGTRIHGQGEIAGLEMRGPEGERPIARAERVAVNGLTFTSTHPVLTAERVTLTAPWLDVTIGERLDTNLDVWRPPSSSGNTGTAGAGEGNAKGSGMRYALETLTIERGAVAFTDRHLPRTFEIDFSALHGEWRQLGSRQAKGGQLSLEGQVSDGSPMRIEGVFDPLGNALNGNLHLHFERLELETFAPYLRAFGGYAVEQGQATLDLHYRLVQGRLKAQNHLVLHRLVLGKEVDASATDLPLKMLVGVLKGDDGTIELDIPMTLPLDHPGAIDIGSVIDQAIREALENLIVSPLETLSEIAGGSDSSSAGLATDSQSNESNQNGESGKGGEDPAALYERARTIQ